ncbi:MAG: ATP-binding protein [Euryarchaeota archaeon]|nr:ATP-binding protein [Euryarchaeota archaeon]
MKEEELIKTHSDLDIQKNLFEENREKLRLKEQELTTLKSELENEIRQRLEEEEKLKLKEAAARLVEKTKQKRVLFPFVALVGQEKMKKALVLNAIYPEIGGVLIRGQKGTGKSVGVRGLSEVLPDIEVTGCRYNCDPKDVENLCQGCKAKGQAGKLESFVRPVQVVDLPLNITEDRLVGSIDIEKVLSEGVKAFEPGILAEAHRGILYVDEINLLDDYIVDILLDAASSGMVNVEREGISLTHPARFIIVGSMNPEEGELRPQILDRIALQTDVIGIQDVGQRIEIVRRREKMTNDPEGFRDTYEPTRRELRERITKAREILPNVTTPPHMLTLIARICVDFNVDGHRADIIIERAARANASFEGRLEVTSDDVVVASETALPHRMRRRPYEGEEFSEDVLRKLVKRRELEIRGEGQG